jgi:hypothetical protein
MHLILSILAGLLGSVVGAAARVGIDAADRRLNGEAQPENLVIVASPSAGLVAGVAGIVIGVRRAFWLGAVLSAAGADRLDARVMGRFGLDPEALVAKAKEAAARAREAMPERQEQD